MSKEFDTMAHKAAEHAESIVRSAVARGEWPKVYLWHGPAETGGLVAELSKPGEGWELVTPEPFPLGRAYDSWPAWVRRHAYSAPIYPAFN